MLKLINLLTSVNSSDSAGEPANTDDALASLTEIFKNPVFWYVIIGIVALILIIYILRRIVRPQAGTWKIIERGGKLHKIIDGNGKLAFMLPVKDKLVATVAQNTKNFASDKLYINNGPDALYKVTYAMDYQVNDINKFYPIIARLENTLVEKVNDDLRSFSDTNGADVILKNFANEKARIISALCDSFADLGIEVIGFKIKSIEPLGKK